MAEEKHGYPLTDRLEIHFLELGKLAAEDPTLMTPLEPILRLPEIRR